MGPLVVSVVGAAVWFAALTTLHLYYTYQMEVGRIQVDIDTKKMWHERIWSADNEHE